MSALSPQFIFPNRFGSEPVLSTHEIEKQVADRLGSRPAAKRTELPLTAEAGTGALRPIASRLSVGLLAADEHHHDVAVLSPHGEIDLGTAPLLREVLLPALERETGPVVVDLSGVSFMDSTGVHVLVETLRRLEPQNRRLAIVCREGGQVHRLLALVGLLDTLTVHRSRESAVVGGNDLLRPEPWRNSLPAHAQPLSQSPPPISPAKRHAAKAS